jgi:hypothetical protein
MKIIDIPTFIIHNKGCNERAKNIYEQIKKNVFKKINIFDAIVPGTLKNYKKYYNKYKSDYYNYEPKNNEELYDVKNLCLMMSHLEIVKHANKKKYNNVLIFENDFNIKDPDSIKKIFVDFNFDFLHIGGYYMEDWLIPYKSNISKIKECNGSFAYIVNKNFYKNYINIIENNFCNKVGLNGVDGFFARKFYETNNCFAFIPPLINTIPSQSTLREKSYTDHYSYFNKLSTKNI